MKTSHLICKTSVFNFPTESWQPVTRFSLNERISYRGTNPVNHLNMFASPLGKPFKTLTQAERQDNYECRLLERGIRPFNYPDELWREHLQYVADCEFEARCEAKTAWMYEF